MSRSLREKWPAMYEDFRHYARTHSPKAGGPWAWMGAGRQHIVSLFTLDPMGMQGGRPGRGSLQHVGHALKALHQLAVQEQWTSIALPRVYTGYHPGVAASEKLQ
ncbi:MAG: hypothetical protein U1F06_10785 [Steroidobacteraceae bacterium]